MCFFFLSSERQPSCSGPHHNTINTVALQTAYYCWHEYCLKPDYCVDPIPSFGFGFGRKNESHSCKIEIGFSRGDGARVIRFFARVIQQLGFWTQKIQASVDYCYVPRRVECTSLGPGLKHPILRSDSSLAAKRRAEALHVVFFSTKHRSPAREQLLCVYSRMIRSHERRASGALLSLFSYVRARVDQQLSLIHI